MENFKVKYNHKKGATEVVFSGHLCVNNIEKIDESMKANLKKGNSLSITTKQVENIDITFVQLIYSLIKSGKTESFDVQTSITVPKEMEQLLKNAGLAGQIIDNK